MALHTALRHSGRLALGCGLVLGITAAAPAVGPQGPGAPLALRSALISIEGTSNIHDYTASTTVVRVVDLQLAGDVTPWNFWDGILQPGAIEAFEVAIPAATLASTKDGLDKNMHKALKVNEHPDITFLLARLEPNGAPGAYLGLGVLRVAGVERDIALEITAQRNGSALAVEGRVELLMTDFGIAPPRAMLGMLRTNPKVTVTFETVLAVPLT